MYINLRDPLTQIILIIIVNAAVLITVEIAIYRIKNSVLSPKKRPQRKWMKRLGIKTGLDLLIFCIIIGVACTVLTVLAFAGFGYIVPIPY